MHAFEDFVGKEHTKTPQELSSLLSTDVNRGISSSDLERRWEKYGYNELAGERKVVWWKIMFAQVANALTVILLVAVVQSC